VTTRRPTGWTRPLELSSAVFWAATATVNLVVIVVTGPSLVSHFEANLSQMPVPPPGDVHQTAILYTAFQVVVMVTFTLLYLYLAFAAFSGWGHGFWEALGVLALGSPLNILLNGLGISASISYSPGWVSAVYMANALAGLVLVGWSLVALVRYGPWAMERVVAA
jgi:hypothetical protein